MKDSIIQRCPKCSTWCITNGKNALERFIGNTREGAQMFGNWGNKHFGAPGKLVGKLVGGYGGSSYGVFDAISGDRYQFICPECGAQWSSNTDSEDQSELFEKWWDIRDKCENWESVILTKDELKINSYKNTLLHALSDQDMDYESLAIIHDTLAMVFNVQNDKHEALNHINQSLAIIDDENSRALRGVILGVGRNSLDAYKAMRELIYYRQTDRESLYFTKDSFKNKFEEIQSVYVTHFLEIPQHQRRYVYLVSGNLDDKLTQLPDELFALPIGFLPTEMDFEGAPTEQMLYVCHPYKPNMYIPYDRYDIELFRDELKEFSWVMECLGAKRIVFTDTHSEAEYIEKNEDNNMHLGGSYGEKGTGKVDYESEYKDVLDQKMKDLLKDGKSFNRSEYTLPYIPDDVVWYPHNKEWQRNCVSRLEGRLIEEDFTISTASSAMISESKRQKLEAEIKVLLTELNASTEHEEDVCLKKSEIHSRKCHVEFWPLSDYQNSTPKKSPVRSSISFLMKKESDDKNKWLLWVMGGVIVALAIGLVIALV